LGIVLVLVVVLVLGALAFCAGKDPVPGQRMLTMTSPYQLLAGREKDGKNAEQIEQQSP
jgi:hypothetical protein